nr:PREDICTED: probable palmitoyltransferase ZDHHC24 [Bemisia tabaci]
MHIRKQLIPRNLSDLFSIIFLLIMIPLVYYFEIFVVLPQLHDCCFSVWYILHFVFGTFTLLNVVSNYVATIVIDTSVKNNIVSSSHPDDELCSVCRIPVPPRSWHCRRCDDCILKQDHHCIFVGTCIGHFNHRYFIWLLFFMFIMTVHGSYLNVFYVKENFHCSPFLFMKVLFPVLFLIFGFDERVNHSALILIVTNFVGMIVTGLLLWYHCKLILQGTTCHENRRKDFSYHASPKENIKRVLGERWHLTWISAFISSKLPERGDLWKLNAIQDTQKLL